MPDLPQTIALHIGAHKTASSHLQNSLYRSREALAQDGIRVYGPGYLRRQGRNLAAMFATSWSENPKPRRTAHEQLAFLAKGRKHLVFTEENFVGYVVDNKGRTVLPLYPTAPERLTEIIAKWAPVQTDVFVAIRNPASFLASTYSQALFAGAQLGPRAFRTNTDWRSVDWAAYISQLRAVAGLRNLFVWRQEDYMQTHRAILRNLLGGPTGDKVQMVERRVNQGMSDAAVFQTLAWVKEGKTGPLAREARKMFPVSEKHRPFRLYSPEVIDAAENVYQQQFAAIKAMKGVTVLQPDASDLIEHPKG